MSRYESFYKELEEKGSKTYRIELTCAELEFIKDLLMAINPFMENLNGYVKSRFLFKRGLEQIDPDELADKIFKQYYDENGELR